MTLEEYQLKIKNLTDAELIDEIELKCSEVKSENQALALELSKRLIPLKNRRSHYDN